jgi:hypothetical protein
MGEAARAEEEAAIGVGRRREGGGRNRIGLRVPAWGKGSGACIFVLTKKREKRRKQRFFVGTDTCTMLTLDSSREHRTIMACLITPSVQKDVVSKK